MVARSDPRYANWERTFPKVTDVMARILANAYYGLPLDSGHTSQTNMGIHNSVRNLQAKGWLTIEGRLTEAGLDTLIFVSQYWVRYRQGVKNYEWT